MTPIFADQPRFTESWEVIAAALLAGLSVLIYWRLRAGSVSVPASQYSAALAWWRGLLYFCCCSLLALFTGVTQGLLRRAWVTEEQLQDPIWLGVLALCVAVILIGYGFIWPKGTFTDGRRAGLHSALFGLLWGLSQGQMFLSLWALAELTGLQGIALAAVAFVLISVFNGNWQNFYWDIKVSPPHNFAVWNARKVLMVHVPNLCVTLPFFAYYGNAQIYVLLQTTALVISAYVMAFPHWAADYRAEAGATR